MWMTFLVQVVKYAGAVFLNLDYMLVTDCQELDYLGQDTSTTWVNQARDDFVCDIARRGAQHLL